MATPPARFLDNPLGTTLQADELQQRLAAAADWQARYAAVLALGRQMPALDPADRVDANRLHGCQADVWVVHYLDAASGDLYFLCDSDARIVKGLLACLLVLYNARSPAQVLATDARPWMREVGLLSHLAGGRSNGLWAMIGTVKAVASRY